MSATLERIRFTLEMRPIPLDDAVTVRIRGESDERSRPVSVERVFRLKGGELPLDTIGEQFVAAARELSGVAIKGYFERRVAQGVFGQHG